MPGGNEIVEEYNMNSGDIESRKLKIYTQTGKENWITEIGDVSIDVKSDNFIIKESTIKNVSNSAYLY